MAERFYVKLKSGAVVGLTGEQLKRYEENKDRVLTPEEEAERKKGWEELKARTIAKMKEIAEG